MMTVSVGLPVGIVSEYGLPWQMIRPLSGILTTVLLPPEHCYPMQGLPSGCHTSSRTTVCFEWKEILLRVETDAASSRTTLGEACLACTSASTPRHETHDIGLPEDRLAHRTWNTAWCPPTRPSSRLRLSKAGWDIYGFTVTGSRADQCGRQRLPPGFQTKSIARMKRILKPQWLKSKKPGITARLFT